MRGRYWLTLGLEGGGTELVSFASTDVGKSGLRRVRITEKGFDPSLFLDDDGSFYWVMGAIHLWRSVDVKINCCVRQVRLAAAGREILVKING